MSKRIIDEIKEVSFHKNQNGKFRGIKEYRFEKLDNALLLYTFAIAMIASIITSLYAANKINFVVEVVLMFILVYAGKFKFSSIVNKVNKEVENSITKKENKIIEETISNIKKNNNLKDFSVTELKKLVWISENPTKSEKEIEIELNNFINNLPKIVIKQENEKENTTKPKADTTKKTTTGTKRTTQSKAETKKKATTGTKRTTTQKPNNTPKRRGRPPKTTKENKNKEQ